MRLLPTAMMVAFLVVIFGLCGVWGLVILLGLILASPFIVFGILWYRRAHRASAAAAAAGTGTPGATPATTPQPKSYGCGAGIVIAVVVGSLTWCLTSSYEEAKTTARSYRATSSGIATVQPREEWVFEWSLPPGRYDRGLNNDSFEARIVKNDSESLWFDTPYNYNGSMEVCRFVLRKNGEQFAGSWSQDNPRDGGSIYLRSISGQRWVGQYIDRTGQSYACTLGRK